MSTEENVPISPRVDIAAYREAVRKHNNKIRREEVLRAIPKILGIVSLFAAAIVATYFVTQWLLASRSAETHAPQELLFIMAILGAILIVAGIAVVARLIVMTIQSFINDVGFSLYFISLGGAVVAMATIVIAVVTTIYLSVFYIV